MSSVALLFLVDCSILNCVLVCVVYDWFWSNVLLKKNCQVFNDLIFLQGSLLKMTPSMAVFPPRMMKGMAKIVTKKFKRHWNQMMVPLLWQQITLKLTWKQGQQRATFVCRELSKVSSRSVLSTVMKNKKCSFVVRVPFLWMEYFSGIPCILELGDW